MPCVYKALHKLSWPIQEQIRFELLSRKNKSISQRVFPSERRTSWKLGKGPLVIRTIRSVNASSSTFVWVLFFFLFFCFLFSDLTYSEFKRRARIKFQKNLVVFAFQTNRNRYITNFKQFRCHHVNQGDTEKSLWSMKNLCPTNRYSAFNSFSHWPILVLGIFLRLFFWLEPIDIPRRDSSVLCTSNLIFSFSYFFFFSFFPAASIASSDRIRQVWLDWHPFSSFTYFLSLFFVFCFLSASALIAVAFPILDYCPRLFLFIQ
jgi:hypothetical protein